MASLKEIREKLQAQQDRQQKNFTSGDNLLYPHWKIDEGKFARLRYLPDNDSKNDFFWVEKLTIKLPFNGVIGTDMKNVIIQVPCMEMWPGEICPILAEVRPWFKDKNLEDMGRKYWKKKSYLMQGFVRENPIGTDELPATTIRKFIFSSQIFNIIKAGLMDPEIDEIPTHYDLGRDFIVNKTTKANFADYSTSKWSMKESPLTQAERDSIEKTGLFNLRDSLPKKPTPVELQVIKEMFEASVDGKPYDLAKWGQYFRPFGLDDKTSEAAPKAEEAVVETKKVEVAPTKTTNNKAEDILAQIRSRKPKQN